MMTSIHSHDAPFYQPQGNEVALFEAVYAARLPVIARRATRRAVYLT